MSTIASPLSVDGTRRWGSGIRTENITAACAIANIIKTSFGPVGMDKMIVDDIGDVTVTNDGATILRMLEVEHPAARVLVDLAQLQDQEVGDGTTSVVIFAAELLKNADNLALMNIHPTSIISGYRLACKEACRYIQEHLVMNVETLGRECVVNAAKTAMSSKIVAVDADFFADMAVRAAETLKVTTGNDGALYAVKSINILKVHGSGVRESVLISGYALNCSVASQACPKRITDAKIACLNFSLQKYRLKLGIQILITDPEKLEEVRQRESDIIKERIQKILNAGANVILSTGGIDDLSLKYFVNAGVMAVRRCKKRDLQRIAKATGATFLSSFVNMEGEETFDASLLGEASEVFEERVCDDEMIVVRGPKARKWSSIVLRGPNDYYCDEIERSLQDALLVVKRVLESQKVVAGGGSVEAALSIYLENFATTLSSREQLAIAEYARALLVIPKTLAVNAGLDATDLVSKLRAYHNSSQTKQDLSHLKWCGLNVIDDKITDNIKAGVMEPATLKIQALKFATEAAITILRVDDTILLNPEKKSSEKDKEDLDQNCDINC